MLNFSEFQDYALMTIPERLPEEYKGAQIRSHEVEKNNGNQTTWGSSERR